MAKGIANERLHMDGTVMDATALTNGNDYAYRVCAYDNVGWVSTGLTATAQPAAGCGEHGNGWEKPSWAVSTATLTLPSTWVSTPVSNRSTQRRRSRETTAVNWWCGPLLSRSERTLPSRT